MHPAAVATNRKPTTATPSNITLKQLKEAAEAAEVDVTQLSKNIREGLKRYGGAKE